MNDAIHKRLEAVLEPGEQLLWSGQPVPAVLARKSVFVAVVGIIWTCVALVSLSIGGVAVYILLPFIAFGVYLIASPLRNYRKAGNTAYAVTDKRVFVLTVGSGTSNQVESLAGDQLGHLECQVKPDDSGDLLFNAAEEDLQRLEAAQIEIVDCDGFYALEDVKNAEAFVRQLIDRQGRHG